MPNVHYSMARKAECVEKHIELRSVTAVRWWYIEKYGIPAPSANSLRSWLQSFRVRGTMADRPRSGRSSTSTNDVRRVEALFVSNPRVSIRDVERELNIPRSTVQRILRATLSIFPYGISLLQQLLPNDYQRRIEFAQHCRREMKNDAGYMNRIVFSNECLFQTSGVVNKHNARVWGTENPRTVQEVPSRPEKVMVCVKCMNQGS